ncbi:MAG: YncE family protein [Gaiellaceae bacterium]
MDRRTFLLAAAAVPYAVASPSARGRIPGGTPLALVTADLEAHIAAVDLSSGLIVRRVPTLPDPRSIESVLGRSALVAHTAAGALSLIDGPSLRVRAVVRGFAAPRYTAADRGGRYAFVTDSGRGDVAVVDLVRAEVLARVDLDGPARHVSLSPSGKQLWVALGSKAQEVAIVDVRRPARPRLVARLRPPFLAHDVGFTPDGRSVWVTSGDRGTIAIYDTRARRIRLRLSADAPPQHVTFIGGRAYVASGDDGSLRLHEVAGGRLLATTRVPIGSYNVQQGWGVVLTPSLTRGTLCVVRRGGRMLHRVEAARSSHDACFVMSR